LSNGTVPISAMVASDRMATAFQDGTGTMFAHGQTFAGQPLAAAVGLAVLKEFTDKNNAGNAVNNLIDEHQQLGYKLLLYISFCRRCQAFPTRDAPGHVERIT